MVYLHRGRLSLPGRPVVDPISKVWVTGGRRRTHYTGDMLSHRGLGYTAAYVESGDG